MRLMLALAVGCAGSAEPGRSAPEAAPASASPPPSTSAPATTSEAAPSPRTAAPAVASFGFDGDASDAPPAAFTFARTGRGRPGRWVVRAVPDAPSAPNVLVQSDDDRTDYRFPVAVADAPSLADVRVRVRCKPVSGRVDQACGLVVRYADEGNYYVTRANALEHSVNLYFVKDGHRVQLAGWEGDVEANRWHDYAIEVAGDHFVVTWDGSRVIDHHDSTFSGAGKVGLWTKADSVTWFDDFTVETP